MGIDRDRAEGAAHDPRRRELSRMRAVATLLLVLMARLFAASAVTTSDAPWIRELPMFSGR